MEKAFRLILLPVFLFPITFAEAQSTPSIQIAPRPFGHGNRAVAPPRFPRIAGEFEPQKAIVLSVSDLKPHHSFVLKQIVQHSANHVQIIILCNDAQQINETIKWLEDTPGSKQHVSFYQLELDTIWLRDFGPRVAELENGTSSIDFFYDGQRPLDDSFPIRWGQQTSAQIVRVPWTMHGGNLICNGSGLGITSNRIYVDNYIRFNMQIPGRDPEIERRKLVDDELKQHCNLHNLVVLEPLHQEATGHVDMFVKLLAKDHALVAQLDPRLDPVNASLLDRNARKLETVRVDGRPMKVSRILIPPRFGQNWSPYTNTISANKMVLMPTFDSDPPAIVQNALETYRRLLPDRYVAPIDTSSMKRLQGSLHCMSVNIPYFAPLPEGTIGYNDVLKARRLVPEQGAQQRPTSESHK